MAEPARTRPPPTGVADREVLATKLHLPHPRPWLLARPRLLDRLDEGTAGELTLVCAPAGFGKTSLLGTAEVLRGRLDEAERIVTTSIAGWRAAGEGHLAAWGSDRLGLLQRAQGRLGAALETYQQMLELAAAPDRPVLPAAIAYVGMAEVAYQRGELDAALRHATEGVALSRRLANTQWLAAGLAALAWIRQAQGDPAGAVEAIHEAQQLAPGPGVISLANLIPAQRARLSLAQGRVADAAHWVQVRGLGIDDQLSYAQEHDYLLLAQVLLANDQADRALALLGRLHALAAAQRRTASVIEVRALQALALHALGDHTGAPAALAEALRLAASEGWLRVFVDEGAPMAALLRGLAAAKGQAAAAARLPGPYLNRLLHAFEEAGLPVLPPPRRGGAAPGGLVLPLSGRELEVLRLLAAGGSNQAIAEEMVVTLDTVKSHVTHILGKLGAANRTQAVARARELGLLT